jgi:hypothetical protein
MKKYVTIVSSEDGKATKYQEFDSLSEAEAHAVKYSGFAALSPSANTKYWRVDEGAKTLVHDQDVEDTDEATFAANEYKGKRQQAYASLGDQLDAVWKQLAADKAGGKTLEAATDDALSGVLKVKSDNPKP